jgi:hypothetical protein
MWICLVLLAVSAGILFRFRGYATWPLATDEYYIFRSISFVLTGGLPEFPCGGYYSRGLLYQYLTAPLLALGMTPEASLRAVSILSNLAMLPAAWLLAFRLGGVRIAAASVTILALSVWEIEMARFGRMYAPFQAVFMWYLYHLYQLMTAGQRWRWKYLLALSIAGPLVWEGGIILAVLNFIPLLSQRRYSAPWHAVASATILGTAYVFLRIDFRTLGPETALPPVLDGSATTTRPLLDSFPVLLPKLLESPWLIMLLVAMLSLMVLAITRTDWRKLGPLVWLSLAAVTATLLLNQLLLAAMVLAGAMLIGWLPLTMLRTHRLYWAGISLAGLAGLWIAVVLSSVGTSLPLTKRLRMVIGFPDLYSSFLYPWLSTDPVVIALLGSGTALALVFAVTRESETTQGVSALLLSILLSLLLIGAAESLYHETRYSFFLYPLFTILALYGVTELAARIQAIATPLAPAIPLAFLACFTLSKDISFSHLQSIDSYEANFRLGMPSSLARHYYTRYDYAGPADYLNNHAHPTDIIITTSTPVTHYLEYIGMVYLDQSDGRYRGQACNFGKTERWSGWPLLGSLDEVEDIVRASGINNHVWIIADILSLRWSDWSGYLNDTTRFTEIFVSGDGRFRVFSSKALDRKSQTY